MFAILRKQGRDFQFHAGDWRRVFDDVLLPIVRIRKKCVASIARNLIISCDRIIGIALA
jgi:hypothetical protein